VNADQSHDHNPPHQPKGIYDLSGTTVVVTGGNDGIGAALARGVGLAGAAVAIWARNDDRNRATVASLRAEGIDAWSVACDVAVETAGPLPVCVFTGKNGQPARDRRCSSFFGQPGVQLSPAPPSPSTVAPRVIDVGGRGERGSRRLKCRSGRRHKRRQHKRFQ
jgi:hypothetical protein